MAATVPAFYAAPFVPIGAGGKYLVYGGCLAASTCHLLMQGLLFACYNYKRMALCALLGMGILGEIMLLGWVPAASGRNVKGRKKK